MIYSTCVWVMEGGDAIVFYAHECHALAALHERLVQGRYHFTYRFGGGDSTSITVCRDQGKGLEALDRELELPALVEDFRTPGGEAGGGTDEEK